MKFEPAVYEHAAKLIGKTPWDVSRSEELIVQAHAAAYETYRHTPVVVGIDIYNLEAEAYGGKIEQPAGDAIPALVGHLCGEVSEIIDLSSYNTETDGRIKLIIASAKRLKEKFPEAVVKIPVSGPFSLASNLTGLETLLCDSMTDPEIVNEALEKLTGDQLNFCRAISVAGVGITFFESAATPPLVPPAMFAELVLPALNRLITGAAEFLGEAVPCIIGGDTTPILDALLSTGTKYIICPGETDQSAFMKKMADYPDVMVRINMKPSVFCSDDLAPAFAEADRVMTLAAERERVCLGSGVLPFEAVPATVLAVKKYIGEKE